MTALELTFPSGRYHATPWARHVNEAAVEWPPSPYRLLRALVATWKGKLPGLATEAEMRELLALLAEPPQFELPPATSSHTRHYMPWFKKGPGDKTLVFDSFVVLDKSTPVCVLWPGLTLTERQRTLLAELLHHLGSLGRAESWCSGQLLDESAARARKPNCLPVNGSPPTGDIIRVLGADPATAFTNDHNPYHETTSGRGKTKVTSRTPLYDPDWHLCMETLWLHEKRWSLPPGARWLDYDRPNNALAQPTRKPTSTATTRPPMQVARFALESTVLPLITDTLPVAEAARINLLGIHGRRTEKDGVRGRSPAFSGKDETGQRLDGHGHCYFLPTDEDGDGHLDHLTLYTSNGLTPEELRTLDRIRQIKTREREESGIPLGVVLTGVGLATEFHPGPLQPARTWISATPFLAPRHPKTRGPLKHTEQGSADLHLFLTTQLHRELEHWSHRTGQPIEGLTIELLRDPDGNTRRWHPVAPHWRERVIQFKRFRSKRGDDGGRRPAAFFRLTFPVPVPGPIALGHSAHFGLGLFVPADPLI